MDDPKQSKPIGRPPKAAEPGKRVSLGLKVTPQIKERLDAAARENGRTQSQEAEVRLEQSFSEGGVVEELFGGPEVHELVRLAVSSFYHHGRIAAYTSGHPDWTASDWIRDPECYLAATQAMVDALIFLQPGNVSLADDVRAIQNAQIGTLTLSEGKVDLVGKGEKK